MVPKSLFKKSRERRKEEKGKREKWTKQDGIFKSVDGTIFGEDVVEPMASTVVIVR